MNHPSEQIAPPDVGQAVLRGQVDLLYQQSLPAAALTVVNAAVLAVALLGVVGDTRLLIWFALVIVVTLGRTLLTMRYRARGTDRSDPSLSPLRAARMR